MPLLNDLDDAIHGARHSLLVDRLRSATPVTYSSGKKVALDAAVGNNAVAYVFKKGNGDKFIIRCFRRPVGMEMGTRYAKISAWLATLGNTSPTISFNYFERGIRVDEGGKNVVYPVIEMEYVDGPTLLDFAGALCSSVNYLGLKALADRWVALLRQMRQLNMAHGDLSGSNVMVRKTGELILIDYDGMYLNDLWLFQNPPKENGNVDYGHRQRYKRPYDLNMDNYSALVIYVALLSLSVEPSLYGQYVSRGQHGRVVADNLLFKEADLKDPRRSALFARLAGVNNQDVQYYLSILIAASCDDISQVPDFVDLTDSSFPRRRVLSSNALLSVGTISAGRPTAVSAATSPALTAVPAQPVVVSRGIPVRQSASVQPASAVPRSTAQRTSANSRLKLWVSAGLGGALLVLVLLMAGGSERPKSYPINQYPSVVPPSNGPTDTLPQRPPADTSRPSFAPSRDIPPTANTPAPTKPNSQPVVFGIQAIPSEPIEGETVTITFQVKDADGDRIEVVEFKTSADARWRKVNGNSFLVTGEPGLLSVMIRAADNAGQLSEIAAVTVKIFPFAWVSPKLELDTRAHRLAVNAVAFVGDRFATAGDESLLKMWTPDGSVQWEASTRAVTLAVQPNGSEIFSGGADKKLHRWNVADGSHRGENAFADDWIRSIAFAPSGSAIAVGSDDGSVRLLEWPSLRALPSLNVRFKAVYSVAFDSQGDALAIGGSLRNGSGLTVAGPFEDGAGIGSGDLLQHTAPNTIASVALSPNGQMIVSGCWDGTVLVHHRGDSTVKKALRVFGEVNSVQFSPDGDYLAVADARGGLAIWHTKSWRQVINTEMKSPVAIQSISFDKTGNRLITGSSDGRVRVWQRRG